MGKTYERLFFVKERKDRHRLKMKLLRVSSATVILSSFSVIVVVISTIATLHLLGHARLSVLAADSDTSANLRSDADVTAPASPKGIPLAQHPFYRAAKVVHGHGEEGGEEEGEEEGIYVEEDYLENETDTSDDDDDDDDDDDWIPHDVMAGMHSVDGLRVERDGVGERKEL